MPTTVVTARLDEETLAKLDQLAARQERTRAWIVAKAVKTYLDEEAAFRAFVQDGEDAIDRGDFLTQQEMEAWLSSRYPAADAA